MGDAADDARDTEEMWDEMRDMHVAGTCDADCPFCDPDFEPFFQFQHYPKGDNNG